MGDTRIEQVSGTAVPLVAIDIDTDRIIPARFLRCTTFDDLGTHVFEDDRQQDPAHPFGDERYRGASILVTGRNFGCGSSREHAPQALLRWGIKAIVGESFAEIFFGNCTSLGIPTVTLPREAIEELGAAVEREPGIELTVDLVAGEVRGDSRAWPLELADSAAVALVSGEWDFMSQLLAASEQVRQTAARLPYVAGFVEP